MPVADLVIFSRAHAYFAAPIHRLHAQHPLPGLAAVATGVHRQHAADRAGNAGEELRAAQVLQRGEARELGAGDTGYGYDVVELYGEYKQKLANLEIKPYAHVAYNLSADGPKSQARNAGAGGSRPDGRKVLAATTRAKRSS